MSMTCTDTCTRVLMYKAKYEIALNYTSKIRSWGLNLAILS